MKTNSTADPSEQTGNRSWTGLYIFVLVFNALLILLFYLLDLTLNVI
jgi:hypothetical protein